MTARRRVTVEIDRLVLRGIPATERDAVAAALHAELRRQLGRLAAAGDLDESHAIASLRTAAVTVDRSASPAQIGRRTARQLARELAR